MFIETTKEELAEAEINALCIAEKEGNIYFTKECPYKRLALANRVFKEIEPKPAPKNKTFKLEFIQTNKDFSIINILGKKGAKVNLKQPDIVFTQISFKGKTYFCEQIYQNKKEYLQRHPKFRPGFHPGACTPKLARVLVNLSGIKEGQILIDPFCGTGGICIEAAFMGIKVKGYDLEESMIEKSKLNAKFYKKRILFKQKNALELNERCDAIVTELPFGKTTKLAESLQTLVEKFLNNAKKYTKKIVLVLPSNHGCTFSWKEKYTFYIHKSLSKEIFVLENA